ncbi:MAG: hypothetical protein C4533_04360 [Candidatus Omnitrophota bacterium]|jgi:Tfp pilus assembly protein PilO|nr:MAG: hypothetical protein C4533_04360 [Candidatus Omnitrophota bacterium]
MNIDIIEKIELDSKKLVLILIVACTILYLDIALLFPAQLRSLKAADTKVSKLREEISQINKDLELLKNASLVKDNALASRLIIKEEQVPALLQTIFNKANERNVRIMQMKPIKEGKAKQAQGLTLISLDLLGDYHRIGAFINDLENSKELIAVKEFRMNNVPGDNFQQKAYFLIEAYVKK